MKLKLKSATELITKDLGNIYKILDKLEQRIVTLEKVLASHAKRIGEMDWQDRIVKLEKCLNWKTFINADDIIQEDKDESKI